MSQLRNAGLIEVARGTGGTTVTRPVSEITWGKHPYGAVVILPVMAGVFDWCLDNNIRFDLCIGVSAGSANVTAYAAKTILTEKFIKELHMILKNGTSESRNEWVAVGDYKKCRMRLEV